MSRRSRTCLFACTGRGLKGHGFDDLSGQFEAAEFFVENGALEFLRRYPDLCPAFNRCLIGVLSALRDVVGKGAEGWKAGLPDFLVHAGFEDFRSMPEELVRLFGPDRIPLFVYGTLMSGQFAAYMMCSSLLLGDAVVSGYELRDRGYYPEMVRKENGTVIGQLYYVDGETLSEIDRYESEGTMYDRVPVTVRLEGGEREAQAYVRKGPKARKKAALRWGIRDEDPVWYASYGSNMSAERFSCYILGGLCPLNGKTYTGCENKNLWAAEELISVPGRMYFARESKSWQHGGVAFYAPEAEGRTVMRAYLITYGQLKEIQEQEGPVWYGRTQVLGLKEGVPVVTLTSEQTQARTTPCDAYLAVIRDALVGENGMTEKDAGDYIASCLRPL